MELAPWTSGLKIGSTTARHRRSNKKWTPSEGAGRGRRTPGQRAGRVRRVLKSSLGWWSGAVCAGRGGGRVRRRPDADQKLSGFLARARRVAGRCRRTRASDSARSLFIVWRVVTWHLQIPTVGWRSEAVSGGRVRRLSAGRVRRVLKTPAEGQRLYFDLGSINRGLAGLGSLSWPFSHTCASFELERHSPTHLFHS